MRRNYSSPPSFGAQVVAKMLNYVLLKVQWQNEVASMRTRPFLRCIKRWQKH